MESAEIPQMSTEKEEPEETFPVNMLRVPLYNQVELLDRERDKAFCDLTLLRRLQRENSVKVEELNINLMPAINNQRRANESLERVLKRVLKYRRKGESRPVPTHLVDVGAPIDEVDISAESEKTDEHETIEIV